MGLKMMYPGRLCNTSAPVWDGSITFFNINDDISDEFTVVNVEVSIVIPGRFHWKDIEITQTQEWHVFKSNGWLQFIGKTYGSFIKYGSEKVFTDDIEKFVSRMVKIELAEIKTKNLLGFVKTFKYDRVSNVIFSYTNEE